MSKREADLYISDMIESAEKILIYTAGMGFDDFKEDEKTCDAVIRQFEILGEAAYHMTNEIKEIYDTIPWVDISDMRNKLIHEYFGVDESVLWKTIKEDLPPLIPLLKSMKS